MIWLLVVPVNTFVTGPCRVVFVETLYGVFTFRSPQEIVLPGLLVAPSIFRDCVIPPPADGLTIETVAAPVARTWNPVKLITLSSFVELAELMLIMMFFAVIVNPLMVTSVPE